MSTNTLDPVLQAIVRSATEATGAAEGWLLLVEETQLRAVAAAGMEPGPALDVVIPGSTGAAGYVAASGEPIVLSPGTHDPRLAEGVAAALGRQPTTLLCVPCGTEHGVVGVLELVDKVGGGPFSFDDLELATILAEIAGAALAAIGPDVRSVATPDELSAGLRSLAVSDPERYGTVATILQALFAHG